MKRSSLGVLAVSFVTMAALLASCTANGGAIFATIEQEVKTLASNLPDTATLSTVLPIPSGSSYLAVSPTLYLGLQDLAASPTPNDVLTWREVVSRFDPTGSGTYSAVDGAACRSAQLGSDGILYALFSLPTATGETVGLYRSDPAELPTVAADIPPSQSPTLDWQPVTADLSGETPERLLAVAGEIFIGTRMPGVLPAYGLLHFIIATGVASPELPGAAVIQSPVIDGAFHDSAYWFIAGNRIFSGPDGAIIEYTNSAVFSTLGYGGIHADATTGTLYLSSREGNLFALQGSAWAATPAALQNTADKALPLSDFLSIVTTAGVDVYVGSEGSGFYKLNADGLLLQADLAAARMPDRTISELYNGAILGFASAGDVVFVCTAGSGLWHQLLPADHVPSPTDWRWE